MWPGARRSVAGEVELFSACGLALISAKWWLFGSPHAALAFTGPEVQFLFPAPVRRWMLVLYKIGRAQLSLILSAASGGLEAPPNAIVGTLPGEDLDPGWIGQCRTSPAAVIPACGRQAPASRLNASGRAARNRAGATT